MTSMNMGSTSKKSKASMRSESCDNTRDRLSELPDEILVHILSLMPLLDAVRTVTIRRFGNLWTLLSSLDFNDTEFLKEKSPNRTQSFTRYVRNVLMLHKGFPVNKFLLHFYNMDVADEQEIEDIMLWIKFAIDKQVKELDVQFDNFDYDVYYYILPPCVFTSQFLVRLELVKCKIEGLSRVQMGSLRKLSLKFVKVSNEMFKKVIDGCPSLQELVMNFIYKMDVLQLTSPTIEKLGLDFFRKCVLDCPNLKFLNFHAFRGLNPQVFNIPSVREVYIQYNHRFDNIVNMIWKVEVVKFSNGAFPQTTLKELNFPETRWKNLHTESQINPDQLIGICRLLKSLPHLKEFIVCSTSSENTQQDLGETQSRHYLHYVELSTPCVIPQLKTVTMRGYEVPCQGLLLLAEFVLKSCVNLEKLVILHSTCSLVEELKFLKQIFNFPRALAKARVIYGSEIY